MVALVSESNNSLIYSFNQHFWSANYVPGRMREAQPLISKESQLNGTDMYRDVIPPQRALEEQVDSNKKQVKEVCSSS